MKTFFPAWILVIYIKFLVIGLTGLTGFICFRKAKIYLFNPMKHP